MPDLARVGMLPVSSVRQSGSKFQSGVFLSQESDVRWQAAAKPLYNLYNKSVILSNKKAAVDKKADISCPMPGYL
jgi:hypothetical protein